MELHKLLNLGGINPFNFVVALLGFFCFVIGSAAEPSSKRQGLLFAAGGWILFLAALEEQIRSGQGIFALVLQSVVLVATLVALHPDSGEERDWWIKPLVSLSAGALGGYILSQRVALDLLGSLAVLGVAFLGVGFATQSRSYGPRIALLGCIIVLLQSVLVVFIGSPVAMSFVYILLNGMMSYNLFKTTRR